MPAPFFTTSEAAISQLEGLYVKERTPPASVSGANLSKVAIVGQTIRGPVGRAVDIGSEGRFQEVFGGRDQGSGGAITNEIWKALLNKPFGALAVVRVAAAAAATANRTFNASATPIIRVDASSPGSWGNNVTIKIVTPSSDAVTGRFDLTATYLGKDYVYKNLDVTTGNDNTAQVLGDDDANVIVITKLASGTPDAASGAALGAGGGTVGSDGSVADSDYTATSKGIQAAAAARGCGVVLTCKMSSAIKSAILTQAAAATDRLFLVAPDSETVSAATAITEAGTLRNDRVVYCFNHAYTLDPTTATNVITSPADWMASILSQTDVDVNPGEADTRQFTAGISKLYNENYVRADYISFRTAGMAALEKDDGFAFVSGVTTSLTSGKEQITRRRSADYIQLSLASALKYSVKKRNTVTQRRANASMTVAFLADLQRQERIVEQFEVDTEKLNSVAGRNAGIERLLVRVDLIGHILELVLETEIGTSVVITER